MNVIVDLTNLSKVYGTKKVLNNINLQIHEGEILALLGPNGSGKTTILKILAFIEDPTEGLVQFQGKNIKFKNTEKERLQSTLVFQKTTLFGSSVYNNIAYGLRIRKMPKKKRDREVKRALELVKLTGFEHRVYLPLVGLLILLSELDFVKDLHLSKKTSALLIMLSSVLIAINIQHISSFKDGFSFWKTAAEASPHSSLAHLNYGAALVGKGHHEKAIETYKKGIRANPYEPMIHNNLAIAYALKGRHAEAEMEFQEEIRLNPKYSDAYYNLGMFYKTTGRMIKAARMWEETLKIDPDHKRAIVELVKHYKK